MSQAYGSITLTDVTDGPSGINTAVVSLYQRAATRPPNFTGQFEYNFWSRQLTPLDPGVVNPFGDWTTVIPDSDANHNPCWVVVGVAIGNSETAEINSWEEPKKFIEDGAPGQQGAPGESAPTIESIRTQYYYANSNISLDDEPQPINWSDTRPAYNAEKYLWIRQIFTFSDGSVKETDPVHDAEFDSAMDRISSVESDLTTYGSTLNSIENFAREQNTLNSSLQSQIGQAVAYQSTLDSRIDTLDSNYGNLNSAVSSLQGSLTTVSSDIFTTTAALSSLSNNVSAAAASFSAFLNNYSAYTSAVEKWLTFDSAGLQIGAAATTFRTVINEEAMNFMDGDQVTAYVSGRMFNMQNANLASGGQFKKGGYIEKVNSDGSVVITWQGV